MDTIENKMLKYINLCFRKVATNLRLLNDLPKARKLLPKHQVDPIIKYNRNSLRKVSNWVDNDVYEGSIFCYGLPESVKHLINNDIGEGMTYSDAILYLSRHLKKRIEYLELGVSVGKNFLQVINFLNDSCVTGFDIEEINPVLENFLIFKSRVRWKTISSSLKNEDSSLTKYDSINRNLVKYISGDIFDENSWNYLSGKKFNIIFSDAFHSPKALLHEWEMIKKYDLLDHDEFLMVWDDLGGDMETCFTQIWKELSQKHKLNSNSKLRIKLNGWLGLKVHQVGIIMKLSREG